jgi:hypothetical protein
MKNIYKYLGLIGDHQMKMDVSREIFIERLKAHVGVDTGSSLDIFASSHIDYKGAVGQSGFYLRRRRGFFSNNRHYCKAIGSFEEEGNQLVIDIEINNITAPIILVYSIVILADLFQVFGIFSGVLTLDYSRVVHSISGLFSMLLFSAIVAGIISFFSTKAIQKMKYELENNFYSYLKK